MVPSINGNTPRLDADIILFVGIAGRHGCHDAETGGIADHFAAHIRESG